MLTYLKILYTTILIMMIKIILYKTNKYIFRDFFGLRIKVIRQILQNTCVKWLNIIFEFPLLYWRVFLLELRITVNVPFRLKRRQLNSEY